MNKFSGTKVTNFLIQNQLIFWCRIKVCGTKLTKFRYKIKIFLVTKLKNVLVENDHLKVHILYYKFKLCTTNFITYSSIIVWHSNSDLYIFYPLVLIWNYKVFCAQVWHAICIKIKNLIPLRSRHGSDVALCNKNKK